MERMKMLATTDSREMYERMRALYQQADLETVSA
jgi:hypothetical protein